MPKQTVDIKEEVKRIAADVGVDSDKIELLAEKCYNEISAWKPYGGATSFAEVDSQRQANEYTSKVNDETYALQSILENIIGNDESIGSADAKASAISSAANDYKNRVNAITLVGDNKTWIEKIKEAVFGAKKEEAKELSLPKAGGFKVYEDSEGNLRWLSLSSNAFEDLDKELFTTKALEEAIEHADDSGERGPLLLFHVPSAEIGQCDFQAMAGRFLVESGTFDNTPLGDKAVEYFSNSEDEHQVSIGFHYLIGDEEDGQYDWARIVERSVCPYGMAANPWTDFKVIGENPMDVRKVEMLKKIFGDDLAEGVIATAEEKTKELEQSVRFKEKDSALNQSIENLSTLVKSLPDGDIKDKLQADLDALSKAKMPADDDEEDDEEKPAKKEVEAVTTDSAVTPVFGAEQITQLATLITDLSAKVDELGSIKEVVTDLQEEVKALKVSDDQKMADAMRPRYNADSRGRPSESESNIIDAEKIQSLISNNMKEDTDENPAQKYIDDLLKTNSN